MLAIIGGSGLYHLDGLVVTEEHTVSTPFGEPSSLASRWNSRSPRQEPPVMALLL